MNCVAGVRNRRDCRAMQPLKHCDCDDCVYLMLDRLIVRAGVLRANRSA